MVIIINCVFVCICNIGGKNEGKHLSGIAGSMFESAFLLAPCVASSNYLYYYQRKDHLQTKVRISNQVDITTENITVLRKGLNPHLHPHPPSSSSSSLQSQHDIIDLKASDNSYNSSKMDEEVCNEESILEVTVPTNLPLHFLPMILEMPSHYEQNLRLNQIYHLLGKTRADKNDFTFDSKVDHGDMILLSNSAYNYFYLTKLVVCLSNFGSTTEKSKGLTSSSTNVLSPTNSSSNNNNNFDKKNTPSKILLFGTSSLVTSTDIYENVNTLYQRIISDKPAVKKSSLGAEKSNSYNSNNNNNLHDDLFLISEINLNEGEVGGGISLTSSNNSPLTSSGNLSISSSTINSHNNLDDPFIKQFPITQEYAGLLSPSYPPLPLPSIS